MFNRILRITAIASLMTLPAATALAAKGKAVSASSVMTAQVRVVHGIPGADVGPSLDPSLPVDISVNGACAITDFKFGEVFGPIPLPAGNYDLAIHVPSTGDCTGSLATISAPGVPFAAGENATVIAHLTEGGTATASKFTNDVSALPPGKARLVAHHTAAAPTVDLKVSRDLDDWTAPSVTVPDFTNGGKAAAEVRPGDWQVGLWLPDANLTGPPAVGPVTVELKPFVTYLVYAVGSLQNNTFTLITVAVPSGKSK